LLPWPSAKLDVNTATTNTTNVALNLM